MGYATLLAFNCGWTKILLRPKMEACAAKIRRLSLHRTVTELWSNLVFAGSGSCGDLVLVRFFNSVFKCDACDDFGEVVKAAWSPPVLLRALAQLEHHVQHTVTL